jgi:transposase-like protein
VKGQGEGGELEVPAYLAMRRPGPLADRMLEIVLAGVSTRRYAEVIPEMADTVGVSKSAVSRETIEASERVLAELMERRLDGWDLLIVYLDGIQFGDYHVLAAVGVDTDGKKHVLGVREGASENAEVTRALLADLVERGLDPTRRRLWVIDGSKALRKAIDQVFGPQPVQRCRNHKLRNLTGHLPKDQHPQVKAAFRAAIKLEAKEGEQKLRSLALWLEREYPSAAASLREGLSELFTGALRAVHHQPPRPAPAAQEVPGHDEPHRQHPLGGETKDTTGDELEERSDGAQVGRGLLRRDRKELPQDHRLRPDLDAQGSPR